MRILTPKVKPMAKVQGPLQSLSASGGVFGITYYLRSRNQNRCISKKTGTAARLVPQRRQASLMSAIGASWKRGDTTESGIKYQPYVAALSSQNWFYWTRDDLMQWTHDRLMPAE